MSDDADQPRLPAEYFQVPNSARLWNYLMGGKDNYEIDRTAADAAVRVFPGLPTLAIQSRQFIIRTVRYLATEAGIDQFLDIGTGLPSMQNTHEVAQAHNPRAKVVYVDNDPVVLAHARALLVGTSRELTDYIDVDITDTDTLISQARGKLDFTAPIGVLFCGILGHITDYDQARAIVAAVMDAVPAGSYLIQQDGSDTDQANATAHNKYTDHKGPAYLVRSPEQIAGYFTGLELVDPGVVSVPLWRPESSQVGTPAPIAQHGGVARKP